MSPYADVRMQNEKLFVNQKERQRFSVTSVRRYFGDYLDMKTQSHVLGAMGPSATSEQYLFSSKCQVVVHPVLKANRVDPRYLCLTNAALYLVKLKKEKNILVHILDRRIPIQQIQSFSLSPYSDNFVVVHCPEDFDALLVLDFKTELVATINRAKGTNCPVSFNSRLFFLHFVTNHFVFGFHFRLQKRPLP
jgi:myosin-1